MAETTKSSAGSPGITGNLELSDDVVATIAGLAARQVKGIYALGKSRLLNIGGEDPKRGVGVEIGQKEAALDLDVVIQYGCDIHETAASLRKKIADVVYQMAGRQVVEVNINVVDIHLDEEKAIPPEPPAARVR